MGMCLTASMASRFSVSETGMPASRSSWTKPAIRSSTMPPSHAAAGELFGRLLDVGLVLQQDVERLGGDGGVDGLDAEEHEGAGPVDGLGDRRRLLQIEGADRAHDPGDLIGEVLGHALDLGEHDLLLALEVGVVDV